MPETFYTMDIPQPLPTDQKVVPAKLLAPAGTSSSIPLWAWILAGALAFYLIQE